MRCVYASRNEKEAGKASAIQCLARCLHDEVLTLPNECASARIGDRLEAISFKDSPRHCLRLREHHTVGCWD